MNKKYLYPIYLLVWSEGFWEIGYNIEFCCHTIIKLKLFLPLMKNAAIRILFLLALLSAGGIIATQVYWVRSAYRLEEKEFNLDVVSSLRNVANKIWMMKKMQPSVSNVVEQIEPDYFIVHINDKVEPKVVEHFLKEEFTMENLFTNFEYGMYDCMSDSMPIRGFVQMSTQSEIMKSNMQLPKLKNENYYFGVYFPDRKKFLSSQLSIWTVSSLVLLLVLIFLAYVVFIILKQKRLSEVQKDFVNNMTHEFKTPLASIQLSAEVLKNPNIVSNPQRLLNYATIIDKEAAQLSLHVERVLQMAHAEKGEIQLRKEPIIWQDLLTQTAHSFDNLLEKRNGHIELILPKEPVKFNGDVLHLKNAMNNLIDNAVKYCEADPKIEIALQNKPDKIEVSIKDNGIGIDKAHHKMLFKRFYRVPTGNIHNVKGFGLGLNYVDIITKAHHGKVICRSEAGKGSQFILIFEK